MASEPSRARSLPKGSVDCHAHVIKKGLPLAADRHSQPARDATAAEYLHTLDQNGVAFGLLTAPSFYGPNNEVLLQALAEGQGRLRGTAIVEPSISEEALADMQAKGVCGLRLNWVKREAIPDIRSAEYQALLAKAQNMGLHIEVYLEGELLPPVLEAINQSGARAVIDHFGHPKGENAEESEGFRALLHALDRGNTWVKLSAPFRLRGADPISLARKIVAQANGERAVWATDWPWVGFESANITYQQCIDSLFDCVPDEVQRNRILTENAYEVFGFRMVF